MNEYRVTVLISKCCQTCKLELTAYGDNESKAFDDAVRFCINILRADSCKPLSSRIVNQFS